MFKIAIVGRANVGKTTLFNRMIGKKVAITHNMPGVTRDRKEAKIDFFGTKICLCDTAGIEDAETTSDLQLKAMSQSMVAVDEADLCLFVIDGKEGICDIDKSFSRMLHKKKKSFVLVVNKCESVSQFEFDKEFFSLGAKEAIGVSAEHGTGMDVLNSCIQENYEKYMETFNLEDPEDSHDCIKIAIIGRPNAGKSTLTNNLLGSDRVVVDNVAGTTRDSIAIKMHHAGRNIELIDTAGIRKKMHINNAVEEMSVTESFRAIDFAHVVVVMMDIESPFDRQDVSLIERVIREGRAIMLVINKWDNAPYKKRAEFIESIGEEVLKLGFQYCIGDFFTMSALKDKDALGVLDEAIIRYDNWSKKLTTNKLNNWLQEKLLKKQPPGIMNNKKVKLKFITQVTTRPATFCVSSNFTNIAESYIRFMRKELAAEFNLSGVPIRIIIKKAENPFATEKTGETRKRFNR